jgi:protein-S-isoprenylcysteine O-methyltransferase Ste14
MLGFLIAGWATPTMTAGHLLFAVGLTAYIYIGVYFEERTLSAELGEVYRSYRKRTPMLFPVPQRRGITHIEPANPNTVTEGE